VPVAVAAGPPCFFDLLAARARPFLHALRTLAFEEPTSIGIVDCHFIEYANEHLIANLLQTTRAKVVLWGTEGQF
jgi:hypothetical protein